MPNLSRRQFAAWAGALATALGWRGRALDAAPATSVVEPPPPAPPFPPAALDALAQAVLPSELGPVGQARATRRFAEWIAGYVPGAEGLHPYLSGDLVTLPPSPLPTWRRQLAALDEAARRSHGAAFAALPVATRQAVVREAVGRLAGSAMPAPLEAPHVALALMAHFYDSPDATDLCYRARIGKNQCRPLVHAPRKPLPLANGGRT